jgi:hypothetical protein
MVVAVIGILAILVMVPIALATSKQYVLKHPKHEHCKAHYIRKTRTVKERGHKTKQIVCQYVAPKPTTPLMSVTTTPASVPGTTPTSIPVPEPFATTTTLSATLDATGGCEHSGVNENEFCEYTVTYSTANSHGEAPPGTDSVLESRVPPAAIAEPIAVPSGSLLRVSWFINLHSECVIYATINHTNTEAVDGTCERVNPRIVLTVNYAHPAPGWLASQSEPMTLH